VSPRQTAIVEALAAGPQTTLQLAAAAGFADFDRRAQAYVLLAVSRLNRRHRFTITNSYPKGAHGGALYTLVAYPDERHLCKRCHAYLAADNRRDIVCSPCARTLLERELDGVRA
jgi:hypothetical protein